MKLAGAAGFEPAPAVLETVMLAVKHHTPTKIGGPTGNRTLINRLKADCSTIELQARVMNFYMTLTT